jgi:C-terminal processing protease CtpA/Prc
MKFPPKIFELMRYTFYFFLAFIFLLSCKDDNDGISQNKADNISQSTESLEIEEFVWEGLNYIYYWQQTVPDLADDRFDSQKAYTSYLRQFNGKPDVLFESLLSEEDRFSWIVDDYVALENQLNRVYKTSGMNLIWAELGETGGVFAIVSYVLPGSDADDKEIKRGDIFYSVNNELMTTDNYSDLLDSENENFSIQLAQINGNVLNPTGVSVNLVKSVFQENTVHKYEVIEIDNQKVGYLMYNGFTADSETNLTNALSEFSAEGIDHFVIDLRYNRGGRISVAIKLASMITGQFNDALFVQDQHNEKLSSWNESYLFEAQDVHLNMDKIYVITSSATASASEVLINGLDPYIDVILIGNKTSGKNVGSYTIYDWIDNDGTKNPNHNWAMQPIALKIANSQGFSEFEKGLAADHVILESISNLGTIGAIDEPLFEKTLEVMGVLTPQPLRNDQLNLQKIPFKVLKPLEKNFMHVDLPKQLRFKTYRKRQEKNSDLE